MKTLAAIGLAVVVMGMTGCATIVNGPTQMVNIDTSPRGASVVIDGVDHGQSPVSVALARGRDHTVSVSAQGYESRSVSVSRTFSPVILGNILIGGVPGIIVDLITGSTFDLTPTQVHVSLHRS